MAPIIRSTLRKWLFKVAANQAFQKGCAEAKPVLMEPYYNLDVYCDERVTGDVISDSNSKRGRIMGYADR